MTLRADRRRFLMGTGAAVLGLRLQGGRAQRDGCDALQAFPIAAGDGPHDVAPAAQGGGVWYTAQKAGALGLLHPESGEVERVELGEGSAPHGVIVGPDGAAWVTDGGRDEIIRVEPTSKELTRFPIGRQGADLNTATFDGEGALWFTGQSGVLGRLDVVSGQVVTVDAPRGRGPYGICTAPDGTAWYASLAASYIGHLAFANGTITAEQMDPPTAGAGTRRIWADSRGRLWVAEWNAGQLGRYDPSDQKWAEWKLPGDKPKAYAVYVDDQDAVWTTDFGSNSIVRFDPATEVFVPIALPHPDGSVRQLLGRPGELWGAESAADDLVVVRTAACGATPTAG